MPKLPSVFDMFIGREGNNKFPQYIKNDLIRETIIKENCPI